MRDVLKCVVASVVAFASLMLGGAVPAFANSGSAASGSTVDAFSFYPTASAAAIYVDNMIASNKADDVVARNIGQASGAAGFIDLSVVDTTVSQWKSYLPSSTSRNTVTYSYDAYVESAKPGNVSQNLIEYGRFGYMLNQLGLDGTGDANVSNQMRSLMGGALYGAWYLANGAENIMEWALNMLSFLNPFRVLYTWFFDIVAPGGAHDVGLTDRNLADVGSEGVMDEGVSGSDVLGDFESTAVNDILTLFNQIYTFCYDNAWLIIVPLLIVVGLVIFLIGRANNRSSSMANSMFKRALVLIILIGIGVPMWGFAYTATLEGMVGHGLQISDKNEYGSPANKAIISTIVDTASWAKNGFDTTGIGLVSTGSGSAMTYDNGATMNNLRDITTKINNKNMPELSGVDVKYSNTAGNSLTMNKESSDGGADSTSTDSAENAARTLLDLYVSGDFYQAAQYESYEKGRVQKSKSFAEWLQATSNPEAYADGLSKLRGVETDTGLTVVDRGLLAGGTPSRATSVENNAALVDIYNRLSEANRDSDEAEIQKLVDEIKEILKREQESDDAMRPGEDDDDLNISWFSTGNDLARNGNTWTGRLSPIGTYNYLNTKFDANGFTVYSAPLSANAQSRVSHYSANVIGGPVMSILFAANAVALMFAFGLTAIIYGLSLLFSNIKRSATLLGSMPFAMFGAWHSIARVVVVCIMMIVEVIATMFMYAVMQSVLYFVNDFLSVRVVDFVQELIHVDSASAVLTPILLIVSIALLLFYIIMAVKLRGLITGAISESASQIVARLLLPDPPRDIVRDTPSHALGAAAGGFATAATVAGTSGVGKAMLAGGGLAAGATLLNSGRESISGDVIGNATASESSINNGNSSSTTNQGDVTSDSMVDKGRKSGASYMSGAGIEDSGRQSGLGFVNGHLTGMMSGAAGDGMGATGERESGVSLGSADFINENGADSTYASQVSAMDANVDSANISGDAVSANASVDAMSANDVHADSASANNANLVGMQAADGPVTQQTAFAGDSASETRGVAGMSASDVATGGTAYASLFADEGYGSANSMNAMSLEKDASFANGAGVSAYGMSGAYGVDSANGLSHDVVGMSADGAPNLSGDVYSDGSSAYAYGSGSDSSAMTMDDISATASETDMRGVTAMSDTPMVNVSGDTIASDTDYAQPMSMGDVDADVDVSGIRDVEAMSGETTMFSGDTMDTHASSMYAGEGLDSRDMYMSESMGATDGMPGADGRSVMGNAGGSSYSTNYESAYDHDVYGMSATGSSAGSLSGDTLIGDTMRGGIERERTVLTDMSTNTMGANGYASGANGYIPTDGRMAPGGFEDRDFGVLHTPKPTDFTVDASDIGVSAEARARARMEQMRRA